MAAAGMFGGFFNEIGKGMKSTGIYRRMTNPRYGAMLFHRTLNSAPSIGRRALSSGHLPDIMYGTAGSSIIGSYLKNTGGAMAINAGVGATYGGLTDQNGPIHGMIGGAFMGAGMGLAGRAALIGGRSIAMNKNVRMGGRVRGLYRKAMNKVS